MALIIHPEFQLYERKNMPFCSSLQVAESFDKKHKHVLESIEKFSQPNFRPAKDFFEENFAKTSYTDAQGKKRPMYLLTRDGFSLLTMGFTGDFTGDKALMFKIAFIKRFNEYEQYIRAYILAREENSVFTQAIEDVHDEPKNYHFSNEYDMINRIVLGCTAKQFKELHGLPATVRSIRPFLNDEQAKTVRKLQNADVRLLYKGFEFQERKSELTHFHDNILSIGG